MSQSNPNNEPTMDEILASIRKIISEDQPEVQEESAPEAAAPAPAEPVAEAVAEVPPLGTEIGEPVTATEEEPARVDPLSDGLATESLDAEDLDVPEIGADVENLPEDLLEGESLGGDFISPATRFALDEAFERMDTTPAPAGDASSSGSSVEAVFARAVQDAFDPTLQEWVENHGEDIVARLTPLIREWMDKNLPSLVEAAVTKEISRAVRSRRR